MFELNLGQCTLNQTDLKEAIIKCFDKPEMDELQRFAYTTALKRAAEEAAAELAKKALTYALNDQNGCQPLAGQGKDFVHEGLTFRVTTKNEYNYNQGDELGKTWAEKVSEYKKKGAEMKALSKLIEGIEANILVVHSRLTPTDTKKSITYFNK